MAVNCVDRHVDAGHGDRIAYHWIGEPEGDTRDISYAELKAMVCQATNALIELGVRKGDRVAIYMPMIPETVVAMLACARLGAPHTVVFGGFSADALREPDHRLRRPHGDHRRRRVPARHGDRPQAGRRRGDRRPSPRHERAGRAPHRPGRGLGRRARPVVARRRRSPERPARSRGPRQRAPALRHVHIGNHRQAEGHPAHHGRLPHPRLGDPSADLRHQTRDRRLLDRGRHRLGHRAQLHRLWPAGQRGHLGALRGHPGRRRARSVVAHRRREQSHASSTPRRPRSAPS